MKRVILTMALIGLMGTTARACSNYAGGVWQGDDGLSQNCVYFPTGISDVDRAQQLCVTHPESPDKTKQEAWKDACEKLTESIEQTNLDFVKHAAGMK